MLANLNYDLNIWNEGWHNAERNEFGDLEYTDENSQWKISIHKLEQLSDGHIQTGAYIEDLELYLTADEAVRLTLGWGGEDQIIGDYTADDDFFLDIDAFFTIYKDIPERVSKWLLELPPLEIQPSSW